ncbi:hypothetical protein [Ketobacter sp.]
MAEEDIKKALSAILYNLCFHHRDGDKPLSSEEIKLLLMGDEDRKVRRNTYCESLLWSKKNAEFDYSSVLLEKRSYTNLYIHSYLMEMLCQLEKAGVLDIFLNEKE